MASRRSAKRLAMDKAASSLAGRTLRAWRERADLQAARKAVFRARVTSATTIVAAGRLRRSFARWQEFHGSSQVATVTRLRAEGHARRKLLGKFWVAWVEVRDLQKRRAAFRAKIQARRRLSLQRQAFFALATAAEAGRREREKVGAALLLWKLHTQGKAFAALAAHRLRRRWKQDRARRAVGWRRERLIKDGALRWAATADAISASRISSAAFREGNRAARRWEAAGRCARHWRRVAAARGMERRARRDQLPRTSVAPMPVFPGGARGGVARGCVGIRDGEVVAESRGVRFPRGGGGGRARPLGVATATGKPSGSRAGGLGKENVDEDGGSRGTAAAAPEPARRAFPFSANDQRNGAVAQAAGTLTSITAPNQPGAAYRSGSRGSSPAPQMFSAGAASWRFARAGSSYERWASASAPARRHAGRTSAPRMAAGVGVDADGRLSSRGPAEEGGAAAPGEGFTPGSGGRAPEEEGNSSPLSVRGSSGQGEEEEEENESRTSSPPMTVGSLAQAACSPPATGSEPPWGRRPPGSGAGAGVDYVVGGCVDAGSPSGGGDFGGGEGAGRRRPAPRRPLELLLDESSRFAATASDNRGQRGGRAAPPLSTWVVDEMNRLFGVGGSVNNGVTVAGGTFGAVIGGDQGRRERATMFRSAGHVDCGQPGHVAHLQGKDGGGRSEDSGGQLFAPRQQSMLSGAGRGEMAAVSGQGSAAFRRAAAPSDGQWERRASTRGTQPQGLPQHPMEVSLVPATVGPPQPPPSQENTASEAGGGVRDDSGAPTAPNCTCQSSSPASPSCVRPATPQFDSEVMPLPVGVGSPLAAAPALQAGEAGAGGAFEGASSPSFSEEAARTGGAAGAAPTGGPGVPHRREVHNTRIVEDDSNAAAVISVPQAIHASPPPPESNADSVAARASVTQSPTSALSFDGASTAYETEEADLEARVAKAERRLRALQERARQRRRDKRELAALHQALAEQEGRITHHGGVGSSSSSGSDGGEVGGGVDCPVDGMPTNALLSSTPHKGGDNNAGGRGDLPVMTSDNRSHPSAVGPGNEAGPAPASIGAPHSLDVTTPAQTSLLSLDGSSSEHDASADTSSRRALLVRMGMVRARLDSGGRVRTEGGWLRPVAESLRREVEELAKSGAAGRSRSGSGGP
ncbi:unnamed protein product [Ectocarpus fasciculatus]